MSGWARRGFSTALRWSAVGTAGVAGIAGAQAWALHARYDPLPDARGPTRGVASPKIDGGRSRAETSPAGEALMKARDEAREFFELKVRPRLERLEGQTARLSSKDDPSLVSAATTSMQRMIRRLKNKNDSSSGLTRTLRRTRRVVIVGDSLVTGVGCRVDRCDGPMLPRRLGEVLAELIGADVEWVAVGAKVRVSFYFRTVRAIRLTSCLFIQQGADLAAIRRDVVPALKRRAESHDGSSSAPHEHDSDSTHTHKPIDAVVLMCGVNDFKHALSGRTAVSFHADLVACVDEIKVSLF